MGTVRFDVSEADMRAESQGSQPNIRNSRAEALARIEELRAEVLQMIRS